MDIETLIMHAPFKLSDEDIRVLRGQSEMLEPHTWDEVKGMVAAGEMGQLRRSPQDLRNYIRWHAEIGKTHGSVLEYVRRERLHWPKHIIARDAVPFAHADDWKIIWNDWPYDLADGMMHLVIWSKNRTFRETLGCCRGQDLLWFKQKTAWQSVKALEHIHVLVRNVSEERVEKLVGQRRSQTLRALVGESMASTETRISSKMS
ncbi:hypothetical protein QIS74_12680 [Colletotrichum tabaci]|uniref:Uncharacterized protein n=1 Tax=Colletotrichum tabaci TaxID=1209068 RepID=A0AAV9SWQ2_9PEZI